MTGLLRRKILIIGMILIVAALLIYGFLPRAQEVDIASVTRGPLQITIEEEGRTRLKERFIISAPTTGYMQRVNFKVGDTVQKGQSVAVLEPLPSQALDPRSRATAQASVAAAAAALKATAEKEKVATADTDYMEQRLARLKALYEKRIIAKDEYDQIDAEARKARAVRRSAAAAVTVARSELDRATVILRNYASVERNGTRDVVKVASPLDGVVYRVYRESEGVLHVGEPLMEIGDSKNLEVRVEVLSSDAVKIKKGTAVLFKRWGSDEPLTGKVRLVEPAGFTKISSLGVEEQKVLVIVDITSPPEMWKRLGDGFRMEAHFIIWEGADILQIPASALFRSGNKWSVFVAENGKALKRFVVIGQRSGLAAEILSGLNEKERVLAYPDDTLTDGMKIKQRK